MNSGILTGRYAKAFYDYAVGRHNEETVYEQCRKLLSIMGHLPKFRTALTADTEVSLNQKLELLRSALEPWNTAPEIENLLRLLDRNRRLELFRGVLLGYLGLYREDRNMLMVQITTAMPDLTVDAVIRHYLESNTGCKAIINYKVDPSIIGGFIYESWGYRADASVRTSLKRIGAALTDKKKRMV